MKCGVICAWEGTLAAFIEVVSVADDLGFSLIGISDSIFRETYVLLTRVDSLLIA